MTNTNTPLINLRSGTRHSFACQRLDMGYPMFMISTVLGDSDQRTTTRYGKYQTNSLGNIIEGEIVNNELIEHKQTQSIESTNKNSTQEKDTLLALPPAEAAQCQRCGCQPLDDLA